MPFSTLGLAPALTHAVAQRGYLQPTPVQSEAIPALLAGGDVQVQARTGSGKTAAFALPLLQQWLNGEPRSPKPVRGLVLVPTRELALQVGQTLRELAHELPGLVKVAIAFGGVSINPQMMGLRGGADIMVATPGRLLDLVRHNAVHLDQVATLVLDEADRLLDLGFTDELNEVLALLPRRHQTVLCSATFPAGVKALAEALLREPRVIDLASATAARPDIRQRAIEVDADRRTALLKHLVLGLDNERALVFVATKYATELVADKLGRVGIHAAPFHGELSQGARTDTLQAFKQQRIQVMVATDMAARGLHIEALPLVVNYDLPRAAEDYIHRIGRTGRAGGVGDAISFIIPSAEAHFRLIEKRQGLRVPREVVAGFEPTAEVDPAAAAGPGTGLDPNGGVKGRRKSKKDKLREAAAAGAKPARR
jgi:superfamily II DNA/RNA helicase